MSDAAMPKVVKKWHWLRVVLRVALAVAIAFGLFVWWSTSVGRGFLRSQCRHLFIEAQSQPDGRWAFSMIGSGDNDAPDPPLPTDPTVVRIRMQEHSMGRTSMGGWSSWRASNWSVISMIRGDGETWDHGDQGNLRDENLSDALSDFVLGTIIPKSNALAIWPDVPPDSIQRNDADLWWTAWQRKANLITIVAMVAVFILVGVAISCALMPVRRIKTA